ncbi:Serine phosphatase RsbU, regulator of sigma subunit protein [Minicystis rosea]|nr:Serine phosphatase RsbU, regulator of sigma subunit protein [Minicystis rosea]
MTAARFRSRFLLAGASVVGPAHARAGRNNQDAWSAWIGDDLAVLVVADGCSGGTASEVGAHFAARWIVAQAARRWSRQCVGRHDAFVGELFDGLTRELGILAHSLSPEPSQSPMVVADLLLTTVLVALIDHDSASVFGIGDGLVVVDGAPVILESDGQRGPEYLAYRLCSPADTGYDATSIAPRLLARAETHALRTLVLATDGAKELLPSRAGSDRLTPLFEDGVVARRPALLQHRLAEIAAEPGLLDDDVTLVALMANPRHEERR